MYLGFRVEGLCNNDTEDRCIRRERLLSRATALKSMQLSVNRSLIQSLGLEAQTASPEYPDLHGKPYTLNHKQRQSKLETRKPSNR